MKLTFKLGYDEYSIPFDPQLFAALGQLKKVDRNGAVITESPLDELGFRIIPEEAIAPDQVRLLKQIEGVEKEMESYRSKLWALQAACRDVSVVVADSNDSKLKEELTAKLKVIKEKHDTYSSGWKFDESQTGVKPGKE